MSTSNTNTPRFWGGEATDLGVVAPLPCRTFRELVDRKLNIAVTLNVSRDQFQSLSKRDQSRTKRVPYLVPCTFRSEPSRRVYEEADRFNLICLDIDSSGDAGPLIRSSGVIGTCLMPFNFAAYTTASSTPEAPRLRIIVEANNLPLEMYAKGVKFVARCLGLTTITPESLTAVQPMYLPTIFRGDDENEWHPLVAYDVEGRPVQYKDLTGEFEDTSSVYENRSVKRSAEDVSGDALDYLRPVVEDITLDDAREALQHVDPDVDYPEWLEMAAALRHQFPTAGEAAYVVFDEWSKGGSKYGGAAETRAKWDSLRPTPVGRTPVTIRTLLTRAVQHGWASHSARTRCFAATVQWIRDARRTSGDILGEGLTKVLATPLITQSEEEALLNHIIEELRTRFGMKVSATVLRKDMKALKQRTMEQKQAKEKSAVPPWAKGICFVGAVNMFYRHSTRETFTPEALDNMYGRKLLPTEEQLVAAVAAGQTGVATNKPLMLPRHYLLNQVKVPTVYDFVYDPRYPNDTFIDVDGRPCVNLYVPTHPEPVSKDAPYAAKLFMQHLENLISEPEYQTIVMDYLAFLVQHPGTKVRWAILIQGVEGCGKTFLAEAMKAVLGLGHVKAVDSNALHSGYNDWAYGCQLITLEEIRVAGQSRYEVMNALKPLISNDTISINQKYRDQRVVDNTTNYLLFTNHHDSLALSSGDRRYCVLQSRLQTKAQVQALGSEYFRDLFMMLRTHAAGLRHWFEHWCISPEFAADGHAPRTTYLYQLLHDSAPDHVVAIRDAINDEPHPLLGHDVVSSTVLQDWLKTLALDGSLKLPSIQQLGQVLRDEGFVNRGRFQLRNNRHYIWCRIGTPPMTMDMDQLRNYIEKRCDQYDMSVANNLEGASLL